MRAVVLSVLLAVFCYAAAEHFWDDMSPETQFEKFVATYNRTYVGDERAHRLQVFTANLRTIDALRAMASMRGSNTRWGVNALADLTAEEFRARYLSKFPANPNHGLPVAPRSSPELIESLPSSWDWTTKGAVTPVKNQGQCGSCWSFSATGNVEGQWFLAGHPLTGLSEQNLVDCDHECMTYENQQSCDAGCDGGLQPNAYTYIIKNGGLDTESSYPYEGVDDTCRFNKANVGAQITNFTMISTNEDDMAAKLVSGGPLAIAADAVEWQFYVGGVFDFPCGTQLDHGILIVGYGSQETVLGEKPYWKIKNSWGADWGEDGYLKIVKGVGKCGLNLFVSTAIVN